MFCTKNDIISPIFKTYCIARILPTSGWVCFLNTLIILSRVNGRLQFQSFLESLSRDDIPAVSKVSIPALVQKTPGGRFINVLG
jgi:hypothetical protein